MFSLFSNPFINYRRWGLYISTAVIILIMALYARYQVKRAQQKTVILLSISGLRSDAITKLGPERLPHFYQIIKTGAATLNAQTDFQSTATMPNHIGMLTGRPVYGDHGHNYVKDGFFGSAIHDVSQKYISSVFDVVYRYGLRSTFFASNYNFGLFVISYTQASSMFDIPVLKKNASRFQSYYITRGQDDDTFRKFRYELIHYDSSLIFLHMAGPQMVGQSRGWDVQEGSFYLKSVIKVDRYIGEILKAIKENKHLMNSTYLIITTDHGGSQKNYVDFMNPDNYTIPFMVWGPEIARGQDLYQLNKGRRRDPGKRKVPNISMAQPVRNTDAANLVLYLLNLPSVSGSVSNVAQDLNVAP